MPARPENVSGSAPSASPSRAISTRPRVTSAAFALSPSSRPSTRAGRERDHVLRGRAQLDADHVVVHVDAEEARVDRLLEPARELAVLARDHGRAREAGRDLLGHVRARQHRDRAGRGRASRAARRSSGSRPFVRPSTGASPGSASTTERNARLGTATTTSSASSIGASATVVASIPGQVELAQEARVAARLANRARVLGVMGRERHRVAAVGEQPREARAPRPAADDAPTLTSAAGSRSRPEPPRARSARAARSRPSRRSRG